MTKAKNQYDNRYMGGNSTERQFTALVREAINDAPESISIKPTNRGLKFYTHVGRKKNLVGRMRLDSSSRPLFDDNRYWGGNTLERSYMSDFRNLFAHCMPSAMFLMTRKTGVLGFFAIRDGLVPSAQDCVEVGTLEIS